MAAAARVRGVGPGWGSRPEAGVAELGARAAAGAGCELPGYGWGAGPMAKTGAAEATPPRAGRAGLRPSRRRGPNDLGGGGGPGQGGGHLHSAGPSPS